LVYERRVNQLQEVLRGRGLAGAILFQSRDIFYYTGTAQPSYFVVLPNNHMLFVRKASTRYFPVLQNAPLSLLGYSLAGWGSNFALTIACWRLTWGYWKVRANKIMNCLPSSTRLWTIGKSSTRTHDFWVGSHSRKFRAGSGLPNHSCLSGRQSLLATVPCLRFFWEQEAEPSLTSRISFCLGVEWQRMTNKPEPGESKP